MAEAVRAAAADAGLAGVPALGRLDPRRQPPVVALRQPGVGARRPPRHRGRRSSPTRRPAATRRRRSSIARPSTSPPAVPTSSCSPAVRPGGRGCGSSGTARSSTGRRRPRRRRSTDDRRRARHDAPGRGRPRHRPPRAGVPVVRIGGRAAAGTSPDEHLAGIAELWSRFSAVAAANPYAWSRRR